MSDLLIRNCNVLNITIDARAFILYEHDILIGSNRIEAVQPTGMADPSHFKQVIEANGLLAMPGLINTHAHVPMVIFRGLAEDVTIEQWFNDYMWPLESNLQAEDVYWGMQLGLAEMIRAGVTSVADHYFYMDETAKAVEKAGTRALLGWAIFGNNGYAMIDRTAQFIQEWQGAANGRIRTIMAPHSPYLCDDDYLRAGVKKAAALHVGIHIHASEEMGQTRSSLEKRGLTPIQVLEQTGVLDVPTIIAHGCGVLPEDMPILAKHEAGFAHAPKTYLKLAMGTAPVAGFRQHGIPVGLATDGAVSNNTLDIFESMRLMAMTQKQASGTPTTLPIPEALYIATRESARVYGQPDELGALDPGNLADLILVDLSGMHHQPLHSMTASLVYNVRASDVRTTICDGKVLMLDGKLLTLDEGEIVAQVKSSMERLAQRQPDKRIQVYNP
ncbi:MAG: amidohydrolase [Chloroflexi bacterium]|nr:amidohydrolase [Chloroflexota bacterium]MCC6894025.1 amidohydrolase [Anaerolineae bacterium]